MTPIVALEGHQGDIFSVAFHPEGKYLASTGFDRQICNKIFFSLFGFLKLSFLLKNF